MIRFVTIPPVRLTTREAKRATLAVAKLPRLVIGQIHCQSSEALNSCNFNVGDSRPLCSFNTSELRGTNAHERLQAGKRQGWRPKYRQHSQSWLHFTEQRTSKANANFCSYRLAI